jgi:hypothetical protein
VVIELEATPTAAALGTAVNGVLRAHFSGADDAGEFQMAVDLLTTNETYFFREPAHYELLEKELTATKPRSLAVWSAASSFGDEAYSTAMLLAELEGVVGSPPRAVRALEEAYRLDPDCGALERLVPLAESLGETRRARLARLELCRRDGPESEWCTARTGERIGVLPQLPTVP